MNDARRNRRSSRQMWSVFLQLSFLCGCQLSLNGGSGGSTVTHANVKSESTSSNSADAAASAAPVATASLDESVTAQLNGKLNNEVSNCRIDSIDQATQPDALAERIPLKYELTKDARHFKSVEFVSQDTTVPRAFGECIAGVALRKATVPQNKTPKPRDTISVDLTCPQGHVGCRCRSDGCDPPFVCKNSVCLTQERADRFLAIIEQPKSGQRLTKDTPFVVQGKLFAENASAKYWIIHKRSPLEPKGWPRREPVTITADRRFSQSVEDNGGEGPLFICLVEVSAKKDADIRRWLKNGDRTHDWPAMDLTAPGFKELACIDTVLSSHR